MIPLTKRPTRGAVAPPASSTRSRNEVTTGTRSVFGHSNAPATRELVRDGGTASGFGDV
jgi:hypothetical protein